MKKEEEEGTPCLGLFRHKSKQLNKNVALPPDDEIEACRLKLLLTRELVSGRRWVGLLVVGRMTDLLPSDETNDSADGLRRLICFLAVVNSGNGDGTLVLYSTIVDAASRSRQFFRLRDRYGRFDSTSDHDDARSVTFTVRVIGRT